MWFTYRRTELQWVDVEFWTTTDYIFENHTQIIEYDGQNTRVMKYVLARLLSLLIMLNRFIFDIQMSTGKVVVFKDGINT